MQEFGDLLVETVSNRTMTTDADGSQVVDGLEKALKEGIITTEQYRANLKVTFLTAHENAQQLLNSAIWVLGSNTKIQEKLRSEIQSLISTPTAAGGTAGTTNPNPNPTTDQINSLPYLYAVILELLRLYPPVSQLINRVSTSNTILGGEVSIPNHTWVGWNAFGVHTDPNIWGTDARIFRPERWGTEVKNIHGNVRSKTVQCHFIAFNAHSRKCLGQGFAVLQMKIVLFEFVRRVSWIVDPGYELKLTSVSDFILFLLHLEYGILWSSTPSADTMTTSMRRRSSTTWRFYIR